MSIEPGQLAPDFQLETTEGPKRLADFAGRKLVLYFYPKDDTSGCTSQAKDFSARKADFAAHDTVILGVSKDSLEKHRRFIEKHELTIPLGSDPEGGVIEAYGCWVEKNMYGRKYMGIERSTFLIGTDGAIAQIWRKVRVKNHVEAVWKAAKALA